MRVKVNEGHAPGHDNYGKNGGNPNVTKEMIDAWKPGDADPFCAGCKNTMCRWRDDPVYDLDTPNYTCYKAAP